jgi:hypothetical protein
MFAAKRFSLGLLKPSSSPNYLIVVVIVVVNRRLERR